MYIDWDHKYVTVSNHTIIDRKQVIWYHFMEKVKFESDSQTQN